MWCLGGALPTLAKRSLAITTFGQTICGQHQLWPPTTLAKPITKFGQTITNTIFLFSKSGWRLVRVGGGTGRGPKGGAPKGRGPRTQKHEAPKGGSRMGGGPRWCPKFRQPKGTHFRARKFKNTTRMPRERPQEREERNDIETGERKNSENFGGPREGGPGKGLWEGGEGVGVLQSHHWPNIEIGSKH